MNVDLPDSISLGQRIKRLRRSRHWTQSELAEKVGIRTGPMNYLENGHHLPSLPVMCRLASVFHVSVDQLLGTDPQLDALGEQPASSAARVRQSEDVKCVASADYRSTSAALVRFDPAKELMDEATIALLETVMDLYLALEDICGVSRQAQIPLRIPLPVRESGLERYVGKVRGLLGVNDAVIFDYLELLENAGLRVLFIPMPENIESVSCYDRANANAFLFINSRGISIERQMFRLCYELGRVLLYNDGLHNGIMIGSLDAEHAARRFAALFLLPADAVITSVRQVGIEPDQWTWAMLMRLKHRFGVSAEAFLYRLEELDLIAKFVRDRLKSEIYAYYTGHDNAEPDSTRRILTPNGRLGDLLLAAEIKATGGKEIAEIRATLKKHKIRMP